MAYLFVYGTLRQGHPRTHRLMGETRLVSRGSVAGTLYDLGKYPGLFKTSGRAGRVSGEVHELLDAELEGRLAELDRYEGREFRRARVAVRLRDGRRRWAWAYVLAGQPPRGAREIRGGVYPRRKKAGRAA